jgi:hypothetical protein
MLVVDSGAVTRLAERSTQAVAYLRMLEREGQWPPIIPSAVLIECLRGHGGLDARTNQLLKTCDVVEAIPEALARRAAYLRYRARRGSVVDALVVAIAEPAGLVLTSDPRDLGVLAAYSRGVRIQRV